MSLVFINVNAGTNAIDYVGYNQPQWADVNIFSTTAEDSNSAIKNLINNSTRPTYDTIMGTSPYLVAYYDNINNKVVAILHNLPVTIPTTATLNIFGTTYTSEIANNQADFSVSLHKAILNSQVMATIMVDGFTNVYVNLGGSWSGGMDLNQYKDSTGVINVIPAKNADLATYYQSQAVNQTWVESDLATITGLCTYMLFHYVIPSLMNPTYTPLTLSADEQNSVTDIQNSILPNIPSTLSVLVPVPPTGGTQTFDVHYSSYRAHLASSHTAMQSYVNDRNTIQQYVQLK